MWSLFTRDPLKDFPFELEKQLSGLDKSCWQLWCCKHKTNGNSCTMFKLPFNEQNENEKGRAKTCMKTLKTIKHPNILSYVEGIETDKEILLVTELAIPLKVYLQEEELGPVRSIAISWGLHQIAKGLSFLNKDCFLVHYNVNLHSIFVAENGEWKLGGFEYIQPVKENFTTNRLSSLNIYEPPEGITGIKSPDAKLAADSWGLGCLIWECFNGPLTKSSELRDTHEIPKELLPIYVELLSTNVRNRPTPLKFIDLCRSNKSFMNNKFVDCMLFLEEIQIKDDIEKNNFFSNVSPILDSFPKRCCTKCILPQLINSFDYGNIGSLVLPPLFKIGTMLSSNDYQKHIVPCIVKLFSSTDRGTRVNLLQEMESFCEHLNVDIVNSKIFPSIINGFSDTNPVVREHTIKAMVYLAPKLNYKNLNEELLKQFARLQAKDDQGGIRTNTTICLGKLACHLDPKNRQKILISAFTRALFDQFPPARQAGVLAILATHQLFTLKNSSTKLLPALCSLTTDEDKGVRDQVFRAMKCFLGKLEKASENANTIAEMEKDVFVGGITKSSMAVSWAGWAISGMSSLTKIYHKKNSTNENMTNDENNKLSTKIVTATNILNVETEEKIEEIENEESEKWGDMNDTPEIEKDGWDNEEWGDLDENVEKTSYNLDTVKNDDFFNSFAKNDKKPLTKNMNVDKNQGEIDNITKQTKLKQKIENKKSTKIGALKLSTKKLT